MNIDREIDNLIAREGGFVNDPDDRGGATKYGITQATLTNWIAREASADDVKNLDKRTAHEIYYSRYYINPGINALPALIQPVMLDSAVNHGQKKAIKLLQDVLLCHGFDCGKIDGKLGDRTSAAAKEADKQMGNDLLQSIVRRRVITYENIVRNDETQRKFLAGWVKRAESFLPKNAEAQA